MELLELTKKTFNLFGVTDAPSLREAVKTCVETNNSELMAAWVSLVDDLSVDWMQQIYQYNLADRETNKQDYTPKCLAEAVAKLSAVPGEKTCCDLCAGSGALTIQKWMTNKDLFFYCIELDENVLPFLLFNLAARRINGYVISSDALTQELSRAWIVRNGEIRMTAGSDLILPRDVDVCISNPPYNIQWERPGLAGSDPRFSSFGVPPSSNANFAFVLTALRMAKRSVLILPNSVLSPGLKEEKQIVSNLVKHNRIEAAIINPDKMFVSTTIGTCLMVLDNDKKTTMTELIDMRQRFATETRDQNGQFGGNSHEGRTYHREFKIYTSEHIEQIINAIKNKQNEAGFCASVTADDIIAKDCSLSPGKHIGIVQEEHTHRPYADIVADINRTRDLRNSCKLTINETVARSLGFDRALYEKATPLDENFNNVVEMLSGDKLIKNDYVRFTKNKNELTFSNNNPDRISAILSLLMNAWKQHIFITNQEENRLLAELRDALLPELMSGKINLSENGKNR